MSEGGRLMERLQPQYQPRCDWCGIAVGTWYSERRSMLRVLAWHRRIHRDRGMLGQSIAGR